MQKAKGLCRGKILGKRFWKMVYATGKDGTKKPDDYYIGETKLPRSLGRFLWKCFGRKKK